MIAGYIAADGNWRRCFWIAFGIEAVLFVFFCLFFEETKYIPHIEAEAPLGLRNSGENPSQKSPDTKPAVDDLTCVSNPQDHSERIDKTIPLLTWRQRLRLITKTDESLWNLTYLPFFVAFRFPLVLYTGLQYAATLCWISVQASVISIAYAQPPYNFGTIGIGNIASRIASITVRGVVTGTDTVGDHFGFSSVNIGRMKSLNFKAPLTPGVEVIELSQTTGDVTVREQ